MAGIFKNTVEPQPYRVYQRSSDNVASISVSGSLAENSSGTVIVRLVRKGGEVVTGFGWSRIATDGQSFSGVLEDVPVGGPYTLEIRLLDGETIKSSHRIPGLLVGDLWILAGQSNMEGCGGLINLEPPSQHVNAFYYGDYWKIAKDPLCWFDEAVEPVHWTTQDPAERELAAKRDRAFRGCGAGLGVRFAKDMYKATGVPIGLVVCPHGGSSLAQWDPALKDRGGESFYGCMMRRVELCGGKVAGCLWYQGEADALELDWKRYKENTRRFIESLRSDLTNPGLPFIYVQLSRFHTWDPTTPRAAWNQVQNDQLELESEMENIAFAAAIDGTLTDPIHIDSLSQRRLGSRLAKLARRLVFDDKTYEIGPRPAEIGFTDIERKNIRVSYNGVNGALVPARGIRGFLVEKDEKPIAISKCVRGKDGKSVIITLAEPAPEGANLWYGRGLYPVVNLVDKADFAAPVFGPVKLP